MVRLLSILTLVALVTGGCRTPGGEPERKPPVSPFHTTQRMKNGSVALEIAVCRIPPSEAEVYESVWRSADRQSIDLETRRLLDTNGLRCGILGTRLSGELTRLLNWSEPVSSGSISGEDRRSLHEFDNPGGFKLEQLEQLQPGTSHWVPCGPPVSQMVWSTMVGGVRKSGHCHQATCGLTIGLISGDDGTVRLWLHPEILHGQQRMRYAIDEDDFLLEPRQDRLILDELHFDCHLLPGETLMVGETPVRDGIGHNLFGESGEPATAPRVLLIRPVSTQADDLFRPANTTRRLSTSLD